MREFFIFSPPYTDKSAGIWMLHFLAHTINQIGFNASLVCDLSNDNYLTNEKFNTPVADSSSLDRIDKGIIIYPELVHGNPFNGKNIVRYMLNSEGRCSGRSMNAGPDDVFVAYLPEFCSNPAHILHYPIFSEEHFHRRNAQPVLARKVDAFYIGKGSMYTVCPKLEGMVEITREWPVSKEELGVLLRQIRFLYSYDNVTSLCSDAALCGAIPVLLQDLPVSRQEVYKFTSATPFLKETNVDGVLDCLTAIDAYPSQLNEKRKEFPLAVDKFCRDMLQRF